MTATQEPSSPTHASQHGAAAPAPIDPENDIDPKSTVFALAVTFVFVGVSMWVLLQFFVLSVASEQYDKIDMTPRKELRALRSNEDYWLKKTMPVGEADTRKVPALNASINETTDAIIKQYLSK